MWFIVFIFNLFLYKLVETCLEGKNLIVGLMERISPYMETIYYLFLFWKYFSLCVLVGFASCLVTSSVPYLLISLLSALWYSPPIDSLLALLSNHLLRVLSLAPLYFNSLISLCFLSVESRCSVSPSVWSAACFDLLVGWSNKYQFIGSRLPTDFCFLHMGSPTSIHRVSYAINYVSSLYQHEIQATSFNSEI